MKLNRFRHAVSFMGEVILPPLCLTCDKMVDQQGNLCAQCWSKIRFIEKPYCAVMGLPFSHDLGVGALSAEAIANPPAFDKARSVMMYDALARRLVQGLKFSDRTELAPHLAAWMVRAADGMLDDKPILVPVPLHRWRLLGRRFNQAAELARPIAERLNLPYAPEMLIRTRPTPQQVSLGLKERALNVRGAFRVSKENHLKIKGCSVVLVDDVYTTGATLQACARALRRAGAAHIGCLTFARVPRGVAVHEQ